MLSCLLTLENLLYGVNYLNMANNCNFNHCEAFFLENYVNFMDFEIKKQTMQLIK